MRKANCADAAQTSSQAAPASGARAVLDAAFQGAMDRLLGEELVVVVAAHLLLPSKRLHEPLVHRIDLHSVDVYEQLPKPTLEILTDGLS